MELLFTHVSDEVTDCIVELMFVDSLLEVAGWIVDDSGGVEVNEVSADELDKLVLLQETNIYP